MPNETNIVPLVDILSDQLGERIVMSGDDYVYLESKDIVPESEVNIAKIEQDRLLLVAKKDAHYKAYKDMEAAKVESKLKAKYRVEMAEEIASITI